MTCEKVKSVVINSTTFLNLSNGALVVSRADNFTIINSIFLDLREDSIIIDNVKNVQIFYNQVAINTMQAISITDSANVFINCNRLVGRVISPECKPTTPQPTSTVQTTSIATSSTSVSSSTTSPIVLVLAVNTSRTQSGINTNVVGLGAFFVVSASVVVILTILLVIILVLCQRSGSQKTQEKGREEQNINKEKVWKITF